jgi:Fe-S-cluster containining protein
MKNIKIHHLKKALDEAVGIDQQRLADEISSIGFECLNCAHCCRAEYGDNTVFIFPSEIRRISERTDLKRDDFVMPAPSQDRDSNGNIHTFEWVLRKNGDCIFLKGGLCRIYECRPYICKTYPFYLVDGCLMISECEGIGGDISEEDSRKLAALLKDRHIAEIKESISLFERFGGFNPSGSGICVHDSEGEHWV